jgi:hypothetical protein
MSDFAEFLKTDAGRKLVYRPGKVRAVQDYVTKEVLAAPPGTRFENWRDLLDHLQRHNDLHSDTLATARTLWGRFTRASNGLVNPCGGRGGRECILGAIGNN